MIDRDAHRGQNAALIGAVAVLGSLISVNLGAAVAKTLFASLGVFGVVAIRVGLGAVILLVVRRPWRRPVPGDMRWMLLAYGATLGLMNLLIYLAFAHIPIGIAIAIEVTGPLMIVLLGSRRPRDFLWLGAAVAGLLLLLPLHSDAALDPLGVLFACGAAICWALYILAGRRVSHRLGGDAAAWGMVVAAILLVPFGLPPVAVLASPPIMLLGVGIAILSSALPYSLEIEAMRRLPAQVFGLLLSASPAIGALAGFAVLGERLTPVQWFAIACIVTASGGSALTGRRKAVIEQAPQ